MLFDLKAAMPKLPTVREYPYWNEPTAVVDYVNTKPKKYDDIDWWLDRTPEMIAIIDAIVTDIMADGYMFKGGKQAITKAEQFAKQTRYDEQLRQRLWDEFVYGDDYLWLGIPSDDDIKKLYKKLTGKDLNFSISPDEDSLKLIKYVPTTTMNIIHDGKKITKFRQQVSGRHDLIFQPNQIIHGKYLTLKGKIYGVSPMHALLSEMSTLSYIKDFAGNFFKNGGVPDWMFILPDDQPNSPNVKDMEQKLKKYISPQLKHGNLVFTGNVKPEKVGAGLNRDMEFRQLAVYLTAVCGLAYGMPMSRIASIIGVDVNVSAGADDLANEGYWSKINNHQNYRENLDNAQLWKKFFDVELQFNKAWKTNEIKEQQRNQFALGNLTGLNTELARYDKQVSFNYLKRTMYLKEDDTEKLDEKFEQKKIETQQTMQAKQMDNKSIERGGATEKMRDQKRKQIPTDQKLGLKAKLTHLVKPNLFYDKFNKWVKQSEIRDCYYFRKDGIITVTMSTPDENFQLKVKESLLDPVFLTEIRAFGKETLGVV